MLRLVEVPPRFRGGGVRPCVCLLAALLLAVVVTPARSQQDDDFGRDFHWLRSLGGGSVGPSQCEMRPSSAVKVTSVAPNALSRARALAEAAANGTPVPGPLPELVDNSTLMYFPPIRHQPIGDCTCYSSAYYYNTFLQARDEGEDASGGDPAVICSPRFLFLIIAQGGWGATCTEHAMALGRWMLACGHLRLQPELGRGMALRGRMGPGLAQSHGDAAQDPGQRDGRHRPRGGQDGARQR